jgi:ABC-type bacteriocin/lantibiotic exporter with double-glycine peptidase domain
MVLAFYGADHPEDELRRLLGTRVTGTSPAKVMLRLPDLGFDALVLDGSLSFLRDAVSSGEPCIVHVWTASLPHWQTGVIHAIVVTDIDEQTVWVNDPILDDGPTPVPTNAFLEAWAGTDHTLIRILPG